MDYINSLNMSATDVSSEEQIEIYKDIEFEKLLDLRKPQKNREE